MGEMHYVFQLSWLNPVCTANTGHWRMIYCAVSDFKPTQECCVCLTENSPLTLSGQSLTAPSRKAVHALIRAGNTNRSTSEVSALDCPAWKCLFSNQHTTDPAQAGPKPILIQGAPPATEGAAASSNKVQHRGAAAHLQMLPATQRVKGQTSAMPPSAILTHGDHNVISKNNPGIMKIRAQSTAGTGASNCSQ